MCDGYFACHSHILHPALVFGSNRVIEADLLQKAASTFANSSDAPAGSMAGIGCLFSVNVLGNGSSVARFQRLFPQCQMPSQDRIDGMMRCLLQHSSESLDLRKRPETKADDNVQDHHLTPIAAFAGGKHFEPTLKDKSKTLSSFGCDLGISSASSIPDMYMMKECQNSGGDSPMLIASGIGEAKDTHASTNAPLRQAFAESVNLAFGLQKKLGLAADLVRVPIWTTTGLLMKFAVTRMLEPHFPFLDIISRNLDVSCDSDRQEAATLLLMLGDWCRLPWDSVSEQSSDAVVGKVGLKSGLSTDLYHTKKFRDFFSIFGSNSPNSKECGLLHMMDVLRRLQKSSRASTFVSFPITLRLDRQEEEQLIIFENLHTQGFRIGLPSEAKARVWFFESLQSAIQAIHDAGVVHLDLYPSNIMWRISSDSQSVEIKIVDWDAAHTIGEPFTPLVVSRLQTNNRVQGSSNLASVEYDQCLFRLLHEYQSDISLQSPDKRTLDASFWTILQRSVSSSVLSGLASISINR